MRYDNFLTNTYKIDAIIVSTYNWGHKFQRDEAVCLELYDCYLVKLDLS